MIKKREIRRLLIAGRGEIVCRIIATCRIMGIETVTVFANDDGELPHSSAGDSNCLLQGETLAETYLNSDQLIAIAKRTNADAIHPGYGFLSENADFAAVVVKSGLIFVGPPADIIALMGNKAEARALCQSIKVPVLPGYHGKSQELNTFAREANKIGYPVLIKALAGGGGKGMRIVEREGDLAAALKSAQDEAVSAFGNGQLLIEKYLLQPRHIEVQVFSDHQKNHVHLFERECSIQRRHQKIIEESPAMHLSDITRDALFKAAITITSHIGYIGAGTIEFIMDAHGEFYFLEMNTRLQVEHPVTEYVTGLDLVHLQLEVAQGNPLPMTQKEITQQGHAIEVRLYGEDAARNFLPASGKLGVFSFPHLPNVRCEIGYQGGNNVSPRYDPMLAKLIAFSKTRKRAIVTLINALRQTKISGIISNRTFLIGVLESTAFHDEKTTTDFLARNKALSAPLALSQKDLAKIVAAYLLHGKASARATSTSTVEHSAWTNSKPWGTV